MVLEEGMTLVEQCVQGEGLVQINVELKVDQDTGRGKINIVDVLKPADEPSEEERSEDEALAACLGPCDPSRWRCTLHRPFVSRDCLGKKRSSMPSTLKLTGN